MTQRKASGITRDEAIEIITTGLRLDLGSYIELLTNKAHEHAWGNFLELDAIAELFSYISYRGSGPADDFMKNLYQAIQHRDRNLYLRTIEGVIGPPVSEGEIRREFHKWLKTEAEMEENSTVGQEISARLRKVMSRYESCGKKKDAMVAAAALTYVFDPEDYISDQISVVGLIDDLYVLRGACALMNIV